MPKEVTDPAEATGTPAQEPTPEGVKFIKNLNPHEKITLPGKVPFSFSGRTSMYVTDPKIVNGLRTVAKQYSIFEDPPYEPGKTKA